MPINLTKGQKVNLTKDNPDLTKVVVGLGWNANAFDTGGAFDLDASAFLLGDNGRVTNDEDFVFYHNLTHVSGAVKHSGDNRTGDGDGDDEQITIDLSGVPQNIVRIAITATIDDPKALGLNFGQVNDAYIRVFDANTNEELYRFDLTEDYSIETAIVFGELYRHNGEWKFNAIGNGYQGGLAALCRSYGVNV